MFINNNPNFYSSSGKNQVSSSFQSAASDTFSNYYSVKNKYDTFRPQAKNEGIDALIKTQQGLADLAKEVGGVKVNEIDEELLTRLKDRLDTFREDIKNNEGLDQDSDLVKTTQSELERIGKAIDEISVAGKETGATTAFDSAAVSNVLGNASTTVTTEFNTLTDLMGQIGGSGGNNGNGGGVVVDESDKAFHVKDGQVVIEAENYHTSTAGQNSMASLSWETESDVDAGGGKYLSAGSTNTGLNANETTDGARLDYKLQFEEAGTYYVWAKIDGGDSVTNNSVHVGLNGEVESLGFQGLSIDSNDSTDGFEWADKVGMQRIEIQVDAPGEHTFNMWMREDGTKVDQLVITKDANFNPADNQTLAESSRYNAAPAQPSQESLAFQESGGVVSIEAENYHTSTAGQNSMESVSWTEHSDRSASGNAYVTAANTSKAAPSLEQIKMDYHNGLITREEAAKLAAMEGDRATELNARETTDGARLDYKVNFQTTGTYYAWVSMDGGSKSVTNNSVHIGVDGEVGSLGYQGLSIDNNGSTDGFEWADKVGMQRVSFDITEAGEHNINMWVREDGTKVDKIIFTQDANFNPNKEKVAESGRVKPPIPEPVPGDQVANNNTMLDEVHQELSYIKERMQGGGADQAKHAKEIYTRLDNLSGLIAKAKPGDPFYTELHHTKAALNTYRDQLIPYVGEKGTAIPGEAKPSLAKAANEIQGIAKAFDQKIKHSVGRRGGYNILTERLRKNHFVSNGPKKVQADSNSGGLKDLAKAIRENAKALGLGAANKYAQQQSFVEEWSASLEKSGSKADQEVSKVDSQKLKAQAKANLMHLAKNDHDFKAAFEKKFDEIKSKGMGPKNFRQGDQF